MNDHRPKNWRDVVEVLNDKLLEIDKAQIYGVEDFQEAFNEGYMSALEFAMVVIEEYLDTGE